MKKAINRERIEGWVYEHNLAIKTVQNSESQNYGKEFINGTLDVQTDDAGLNIVTVNFTYVTETTSKGTKNETYTALKNIIESGKTVLTDGKEAATMVRIDTALGLNDFYTNRNGEEVLVSAKRNDGGFVHITNKLSEEKQRNRFEVDMLINGTTYVEADPERHIDKDYLIVKGAVFNFRNALLPVELVVKGEGGIKYFESLDASPSNVIFTKVKGAIQSQTIVDKREERGAFGEPSVREYERSVKEWVIDWAAEEPYEIGSEKDGITVEDIKEATANREIYLAETKKRADEYRASQANTTPAATATSSAAAGGFNF